MPYFLCRVLLGARSDSTAVRPSRTLSTKTAKSLWHAGIKELAVQLIKFVSFLFHAERTAPPSDNLPVERALPPGQGTLTDRQSPYEGVHVRDITCAACGVNARQIWPKSDHPRNPPASTEPSQTAHSGHLHRAACAPVAASSSCAVSRPPSIHCRPRPGFCRRLPRSSSENQIISHYLKPQKHQTHTVALSSTSGNK